MCHLCASACKCVRVGDTGGGRGGRGRGGDGGGSGGDDDDDDDDDGAVDSRGGGSKAARCVTCVRLRVSVFVWVTREVAGEDEAAAATAAAAAATMTTTTTTTTTTTGLPIRAAADPRQPGVSLVCECV